MGKMQYLPGASAPLHPGVVILGFVCTPECNSRNFSPVKQTAHPQVCCDWGWEQAHVRVHTWSAELGMLYFCNEIPSTEQFAELPFLELQGEGLHHTHLHSFM